MKEERVSYMMLFCALLLVKNSKATLEQSLNIVPLAGRAKFLAGELTHRLPVSGHSEIPWAVPTTEGVVLAFPQDLGG